LSPLFPLRCSIENTRSTTSLLLDLFCTLAVIGIACQAATPIKLEDKMTTLKVTALSGLILAAIAGCTSSGQDMGAGADTTSPTQYRPANTEHMPNFMSSTSIGQVMTTPQGSTVYTFDQDQAGKSNCYGDCARSWPPVIAANGARPYGLMSLNARQNGQEQWAYDGKPLYTYAGDSMHGDVKGEDAGNVWHVVR
jgi:predicted lipoprotein with Yx(FWY)xxD motif